MSTQNAKVDRQPSTADEIVQPITSSNAISDPSDDLDADDQRWIETVMASLSGRSRAAQEALAKALINGDRTVISAGHVSGLELDRGESKGGRHDAIDSEPTPHVNGTTSPRAHPVSGTMPFPAICG